MKLQIFILTLGIVASAGAVNAELNRSTGGATTTQVASAPIAAAQSTQQATTTPATSAPVAASQTSPKQSTINTLKSVSQPVSGQQVTTQSTSLPSGAQPSITGISASGENDD